MEAIDILYLTLSLAALVFVGIVVTVSVVFIKTLQAARRVVDQIEETAGDISVVRNSLKIGLLTAISKVIGTKERR